FRVPEKTDGPKWRPAPSDILKRLRESVDDEPKHAAHFAEKSAAFLPDPGDDDDRIGLDLAASFQFAVLPGHDDGKLPYFPDEQRILFLLLLMIVILILLWRDQSQKGSGARS